ncbi:YdeI/OmpD-associated family protein [Haladaptatus caseinilyticus]|uniref:YdeI/OmpD-associated family protein n=1 Tax=Haladaptatus caseinilyticus TaxID=2993314 RepID=UPI00224AFAF2|nr:YdeI/OmpD-associated family protein [Haladaptatus caseinilyticus]
MNEDPIFFESREAFRDWLNEHHDTVEELWIGYYKADAEKTGIGYDESVEEALCFGWIDGLVNGIDDNRYKRRFTPRKPGSKWSKKNTERARAMIEAGKMRPAGMELIEAAKRSGEWEGAYRLADDHEIPAELEAALKENGTAWQNFQIFSNTDQHAFIVLVEEAKTAETKSKRIERTVELAEGNLRAYDEQNKLRL